MDFESLGHAWRSTPQKRSEADRLPGVVRAVRERAERLTRAVRRRDLLESSVALVLVPVFVVFASSAANLLSAAGALIVAVSCAFVPLRLAAARRTRPDPSLPLTAALRTELAAARAQQRLLGSVFWWYVAPIGGGVILYVAAGPASPAFRIGYTVAALLLCALVFTVNRRVARNDVEPHTDELERLIEELESIPGETDDA